MDFFLNLPTEGVPALRHPVYWDRRLPVTDNLDRIDSWRAHYQDRLPAECAIDEAAILVPNYWHRSQITGQLLDNGWGFVADAQDLVYTSPFGTRYCVEYQFYTRPMMPYRLEVMTLVPDAEGAYGRSPLHEALWIPGEDQSASGYRYPIPHLSFKPAALYHETVLSGNALISQRRRSYGRAVQHLRDGACIHAQSCQSTYGHFGYFIGNETQRQIYIKPRVNLRDVSQ